MMTLSCITLSYTQECLYVAVLWNGVCLIREQHSLAVSIRPRYQEPLSLSPVIYLDKHLEGNLIKSIDYIKLQKDNHN